jgi:hypothetical protein
VEAWKVLLQNHHIYIHQPASAALPYWRLENIQHFVSSYSILERSGHENHYIQSGVSNNLHWHLVYSTAEQNAKYLNFNVCAICCRHRTTGRSIIFITLIYQVVSPLSWLQFCSCWDHSNHHARLYKRVTKEILCMKYFSDKWSTKEKVAMKIACAQNMASNHEQQM